MQTLGGLDLLQQTIDPNFFSAEIIGSCASALAE
jgi:hypothetical protein